MRGFSSKQLSPALKGGLGYVRARGCRLAGEMTGRAAKYQTEPSAAKLVESSLMALASRFTVMRDPLFGVSSPDFFSHHDPRPTNQGIQHACAPYW